MFNIEKIIQTIIANFFARLPSNTLNKLEKTNVILWYSSALCLLIIFLLANLIYYDYFMIYAEKGLNPFDLNSEGLKKTPYSHILMSVLTGDDFGCGHVDIISDSGKRCSTDPMDWGFGWNFQYGQFYSNMRNSDGKVFASMCDYLYKVHNITSIDKETIAIVCPDNKSAQTWMSDYNNSWGRGKDQVYQNNLEFRTKLRDLTYYERKRRA